ncbi:MAG: hypothetical protein K9L74_02540 [Candidatus Izimaplasma sp.]|nr:hypothetical protein [Candidatus Izimaplasma bacterium]
MVYDTEFTNDSWKLIRVNVTDDLNISVGNRYIVNLHYNEDNDVYFISQQSDSIIRFDSSNSLSGAFLTEEYPNDLDKFIDSIFN